MASCFHNLFTRSTSTTAKVPSPDVIDTLFPLPTKYPPSLLSPRALPGSSPETEKALLEILKDNHRNHHIFFNDLGHVDHVVHHMLGIYAMGGSEKLLRDGYKNDGEYQRPIGKSPMQITQYNFVDHLGDTRYYQAYLVFFTDQLLIKGVDKTLEEYLYSERANFNGRNASRQPEMFARFMSGLVHPLIHVGHGLEFGLLGVLAEGLAQATVHPPTMSSLLPNPYFHKPFYSDAIATVVSRVSTLFRSPAPKVFPSAPPQSRDAEVSVFDVFALILQDENLYSASTTIHVTESLVTLLLKSKGDTIRKYSEMWSLDVVGSPNPDQEVERKIEELAWATTVIYGISGFNEGPPFKDDFALMHLVTSSLFLPSICAYFPPHAIEIFLRSYFSVCLAVWVTKGRPSLEVKPEFFSTTNPSPQEPIGDRTWQPGKDTLLPDTVSPNPWLAILQSSMQHPDYHVCKIQRALGHWGQLFGGRPQGYWAKPSQKGGAVQLKGVELLDGSLFIRTAGLTQTAKGWMREGQERGEWTIC